MAGTVCCFCHKSGTIVPQPHKKCLWKQTDKRNCNTTDSKIRNRHCKKNPNVPVRIHNHTVDATAYPHPSPNKKKKMQTFPVSKTAARTVFPVKCCYMRTVLKSIYLISGKDPLPYTLTSLQEKHPQKIQAETGILLFHTRPTYTFLQFMRFSPDSEDFYMPKVQKLFWHPVIFHRRSSDRVHRCHVPRHQGTLPHLNADVPVLNYALNTHQ